MNHKYFILIVFFIALNSCQKRMSNDKIREVLELNKENIVFLSFYPGMPNDVFEYNVKKEISKGVLKNKEAYSDGPIEPYYSFDVDNKNFDYQLSIDNYSVGLYKYIEFYSSNLPPSKFEIQSYKGLLNSQLESLNRLYLNKYQLVFEESFEKRYIDTKDKKVIIIKTDYSDYSNSRIFMSDGKGNGLIFSYNISIKYYTKSSYDRMIKSLKRQNELRLERENKREKERLKIEQEKKERKLNEI